MNVVRNVLAIVVGAIIGGLVNSYIIGISSDVIPLPEGVDPNDMDSLVENIHLFTPINFLMPFLAHALGTLVGAVLAGFIAFNHKLYYALAIGGFFLIGGISMVFLLPAPLWFNATDLILAYIPMAWIGGKIAIHFSGSGGVDKP